MVKKKFGFFILILIAILTVGVLYSLLNGKETDPVDDLPDVPEPSESDEKDGDFDAVGLINQILQRSENGMLLELPFAAGETEIGEVYKVLGEPDRTDHHEGIGSFAQYNQYEVSIGYKERLFSISGPMMKSFKKSIMTLLPVIWVLPMRRNIIRTANMTRRSSFIM